MQSDADHIAQAEFRKLEYEALRSEILAAQERNFRTMMLGIIAAPAAKFVIDAVKAPLFTTVLPFLVIIIALRYLADNHGIMRCGRYIKEHIEQYVERNGWETWLERPAEGDLRRTEMYLSTAFLLLFFLYYVATSFVGATYIWETFNLRFPKFNAAAYVATIGVGVAYFVIGYYVGRHILEALRVSVPRILSLSERVHADRAMPGQP
jgi:uncharacterized membrane protein YfcA